MSKDSVPRTTWDWREAGFHEIRVPCVFLGDFTLLRHYNYIEVNYRTGDIVLKVVILTAATSLYHHLLENLNIISN
jgi:hypothetical protein